jgi:acetylornithine aminotransferase
MVKNIRGQGLMIGIELDRPCADLVNQARAQGLLINVTAGSVIRLLPPLILNQQQAEKISSTVIDIITRFANQD